MKAIEFGAAAVITEPISNPIILPRNIVLIGKRVKSCPCAGWKAMIVKKYELPYHPVKVVDSKSVVRRGIAVAGKYVKLHKHVEFII